MANTKISDLTASASSLASTDLAPIVQTPGVGPVKMTGLQLAGGLLGSATFNGSTVTTSQPVLNLSQTWNAGAVTFTGLKFNATDTASASGSLLLDLQVGGASKVVVTKTGTINTIHNGNANVNLIPSAQSGMIQLFNGNVQLFSDAAAVFNIISSSVRLASGQPLSFSTDLFLTRANTATLQLGAADVASGAVPQTLQVQSNTGAGTTGPNFTIKGSAGTTAGGSIIFQTAATTSFANALVIDSTGATAINNATVVGNTKLTVSGTSGLPSTTFKGVASFYSDNNLTLSIGGQQNSTYLQALDRRSGSAGQYGIFLNPQGGNVGVGYFGGGSGVWQPGATLTIVSTGSFGWDSGSGASGTADVTLFRDTNDTLALRRTTTAGPTTYAQQFNVYKNYTDASNYARLSIGNSVDTNTHYLYVEQAGTGGAKDLLVGTSGASNILFYSGANPRWYISSAGHFLAGAVGAGDNTYDIGASGANRPRNIYVGTNFIGSMKTSDGSAYMGIGATGFYAVNSGTGGSTNGFNFARDGSTNGVCLFRDGPETGSGFLVFGTARSTSFPALKRSSATLQVRLADDSADAALSCGALSTSGNFGLVGGAVITVGGAAAAWANTGQQFVFRNQIGLSSTNSSGAYDAALVPSTSGVLKVIGSSSSAGGSIQYNAYTYSALPTGAVGMVAYVSDASNAGAAWGDSVTAGGSTNKYLVWYNGTNWTVIGK